MGRKKLSVNFDHQNTFVGSIYFIVPELDNNLIKKIYDELPFLWHYDITFATPEHFSKLSSTKRGRFKWDKIYYLNGVNIERKAMSRYVRDIIEVVI